MRQFRSLAPKQQQMPGRTTGLPDAIVLGRTAGRPGGGDAGWNRVRYRYRLLAPILSLESGAREVVEEEFDLPREILARLRADLDELMEQP